MFESNILYLVITCYSYRLIKSDKFRTKFLERAILDILLLCIVTLLYLRR